MVYIPAESWVRRGTILIADQPWEFDPDGWAFIAESSLVKNQDGYQLWYSGGGNLTHGLGYATGPSAFGPFTKFVPPIDNPISLVQPSFEVDSNSDGLADGWVFQGNVGGSPTYSLVTGRTGGKAQRVQYTLQAGDTGKYFWIYQRSPAGTCVQNENVNVTEWVKGSISGGCHAQFEMLSAPASKISM